MMLKFFSLSTLLWVVALSGLIVLADVLVLSRRRGAEAAVPRFVSVARSVFAWSAVIALLWYAVLLQGLELALVLGTLLTGGIYALEVLVLRRRRREARDDGAGEDPPEPAAVEYARSFFPVILIVLLVRSFLFEPFRIPSESMLPTLLVGDFIFVNKFTYGIRLPVLRNEVVSFGAPDRGDVVVFRLPSDGRTNYIKRVVGLPGDRVTYYAGQLRVNGDPVPIEPVGRYTGPGSQDAGPMLLLREQLGGHEHDVLRVVPEDPRRVRYGEWRVPEGYYFMMGDNRDNSRDSRFPQVGFVPEDNLVGRAEVVWLSISLPPRLGIRLGRFGNPIS